LHPEADETVVLGVHVIHREGCERDAVTMLILIGLSPGWVLASDR
jgi:hypothetical protein